MAQLRGGWENKQWLKGSSLNMSNDTNFTTGFPLGGFCRRIDLHFHLAVTDSSGSSAISEGELNIIKSVKIESPNGEVYVNNCPGRALYRYAQIMGKTAPDKDAFADASATYDVHLPIDFGDRLLGYESDTYIDTRRFNNLTMRVTMGGITDLYGTEGTSSVTATLDAYAEMQYTGLPKPGESGYPNVYPELRIVGPVNPETQAWLDLENASDLAIKRALLFSSTSATSGVPFSGTPSSAVITSIIHETDLNNKVDSIPYALLNAQNKRDYQLETALTGLVVVDFTKMSNYEAFQTGGRSRNKITWTNASPSTSQVCAMVAGVRSLRG